VEPHLQVGLEETRTSGARPRLTARVGCGRVGRRPICSHPPSRSGRP